MKPKSTLRSYLLLAGSSLLAISYSHAGQIWDGGGADDNWSTAGNWDGTAPGVLPNFANAITFTGNTRNSAFNDRTAASTIGGINLTNDGSVGKTNVFTLSGNSITLGGNITTTANTTGSTITDTISLAMILNGNRVITTNQLSSAVQHNLTIGGVVSQDATNRSLTKAGAGTLTLNGSATNTFAGGLVVNGGLLALDYANIAASTNLVANTNTLTLGGGNLTLKGLTGGGNATTQTLGNVTVNAGGGTLLINPNGGASTTLTLGTINPTAQGTSLTLGAALSAGTGTVTITTTTNKNAQDIYGGRIVLANGTADTGYDWATTASVGSPYALSAYSSYTAIPGGNYAGGTDTLNSKIDSNVTLDTAAWTTNSLKIENPAASQSLALGANSLTLTSGGLLVTGTNAVQITGDTGATRLTASNGSGSYDLVVSQFNSGGLDIGAVIGNNGANATSLTKAGTGTLTLSGSNTFTGGLFINSGNVTLANSGALVSTAGSENAVTLASSGVLTLNGNSVVVRSLGNTNTTDVNGAIVQNANSTAATLTVGNSANAASTYAGIIQDGSGGGALTLAKSGSGTLTLTGTNTYTGGTTLNAGRIVIGSDANLGNAAGTITVNADMQLQTSQNITSARDIVLNSGAILFQGGNTTFTTTGNASGTGGVGTSNIAFGAQILLNGTNNTFLGPVIIGRGMSGGNSSKIEVKSLADSASANGKIIFESLVTHTTLGSIFRYTGTTNLELNHRQIELAAANTNPGHKLDNNSTNNSSMKVNTDLLVSGSGARIFQLNGTSTATNEFNGKIIDGSGAPVSLIVNTSGGWALSGSNTYTGSTSLVAGKLTITSIDNVANPNPLGQSSAAAANLALRGGTLAYTGGSGSTDRNFAITANSSIDSSGTGPLAFGQTGVISPDVTGLTGTTTAGSAVVTGLSSTADLVVGMTVSMTGVPAGRTIASINSSSQITLSSGTSVTAGTNAATFGYPARTLTLTGTNTGANTIAGILQDSAAGGTALNLTKAGAGTWVLSGANTYSGNTTLSNGGGTLKLNYSSENNSKIAGVLTLGNGTTLELIGGSHPEAVASTTLSANAVSFVTQTGGSSVLQMGAITRNAGAYITFSGSGIATTSTPNNAFGILGNWATVNNGNDWAVNSASPLEGPITAPVYTDVARLGGSQVIADVSASQVRIIEGAGSAADITLAAATTTIGTLTQSTTGGGSVSVIDPAGQSLAVGAILAQNGAGSLTIGNGTNNGNIQALSAAGDLTVNTVGGSTVTINSAILDVSNSTLTKMGTGTLVLTNTNTYAGGTTIINNGGTLRITNPAALGTGAVTIGTSGTNTGTLELALTGTNSITNTFNGFGSANNLGSGNAQILNTSGDNTITSDLTITTTGGNGLNVASNGGLLTLSGTITHTVASIRTLNLGGTGDGVVSGNILNNATGPVTLALTKTGAGTWTLSGTGNTYSGTTSIAGGTLKFGASNVIPDASAVNVGSATAAGTLDIAGFSDQLGTGTVTTMLTLGSSSTTVGGLQNQVINSGGSAVLAVDGGIGYNAGATGFHNGKGLISANIQLGVTTGVNRNFSVNDSIDAPIDLEVTGVVSSGTNSITKEGLGTLFLNHDANIFTGQFIVNNGKTQVTKLADAGSVSSVGTGTGTSTIRLGDTQNPTLEYVGSTDSSTNRRILLGTTAGGSTGATILNNGAGKLTFSDATGFNNTNVATIARTLTLGGSNTLDNTISGAISDNTGVGGTVSITKQDDGTWILGGSNTYTGTTTINDGTLVITGATQATSSIVFGGGVLGLDIASPVTAASATIDFTGQSVLVTGTPTLSSYTLLTASSITGTPTLATPISGYTLVRDGNALKLNATGSPTGYAAWQSANGTMGTRAQDHDGDGVDNGTEHFLGGTANTTGFTALPGVVNTAGILSITWTKAGTYTGTYGTDFTVETSATLAGPWTPETVGGNVTITGNNVTYTFPGGPAYSGKNFARLKVTGP